MAVNLNDSYHCVIPTSQIPPAIGTGEWISSQAGYITAVSQACFGSRPPLQFSRVLRALKELVPERRNNERFNPSIYDRCDPVGDLGLPEASEFVKNALDNKEQNSSSPIVVSLSTVSETSYIIGTVAQAHFVTVIFDPSSHTIFILDGKGYDPRTLPVSQSSGSNTPSQTTVYDAILRLLPEKEQEDNEWTIEYTSNIQNPNDCIIDAMVMAQNILNSLSEHPNEKPDLSIIQADLMRNSALIEEIRRRALPPQP